MMLSVKYNATSCMDPDLDQWEKCGVFFLTVTPRSTLGMFVN